MKLRQLIQTRHSCEQKLLRDTAKLADKVAQVLLKHYRGGSLAGSEKGAPPGTWQWPNREAQLVRGMLRALHTHCLQHLHNGWMTLEHTTFRLRSARTLTFHMLS